MGRNVAKPKNHIISCRVTDCEIEVLKRLARTSNTNISNLLRHSLDLLEEVHIGKEQVRA